MGGTGRRVRADVLAVEIFAELKVGQLLGQADRVERIAGGAKHSANLRGPLLKTLQVIGAMVEDDTRICVVNTVIHVVAELPAPYRLADDLGNGSSRRGHEKPAWLRENLDILVKEPVDLMVDLLREVAEFRHAGIVGRGESTADIEQPEIEAAGFRLGEDAGTEVDRLDVVFGIRALAADVERQPFNDEALLVSVGD